MRLKKNLIQLVESDYTPIERNQEGLLRGGFGAMSVIANSINLNANVCKNKSCTNGECANPTCTNGECANPSCVNVCTNNGCHAPSPSPSASPVPTPSCGFVSI